jgi:hypothetical protein
MVPCAIVLFVLARLLVLADEVAVVLLDRIARGEACLHVRPHLQAVQVEAGLLLVDQRR